MKVEGWDANGPWGYAEGPQITEPLRDFDHEYAIYAWHLNNAINNTPKSVLSRKALCDALLAWR